VFTHDELRFMDFCEQHYLQNGLLPSKERVHQATGITPAQYDKFSKNERLREELTEVRGIRINTSNGALSPEQVVAINVLMNVSDTRSERKKLSDMKISVAKWNAWKSDPVVQEYMRDRAENLLTGAIPDAHMALIGSARRGQVDALKLLYGMTGRYSDKGGDGIDPNLLIRKVIEVIQRHVTDPVALANIADDLVLIDPNAEPRPKALSPAPALSNPAVGALDPVVTVAEVVSVDEDLDGWSM
jgi:hypothetical protein